MATTNEPLTGNVSVWWDGGNCVVLHTLGIMGIVWCYTQISDKRCVLSYTLGN